MATKRELGRKKEHAKMYYMRGELQKNIAEIVGVSEQSIVRWAKKDHWEEKRAAVNITRPELINKILSAINKELDAINDADSDRLSDRLAKFASAIEKLDKHATVVDAIEVFMDVEKWYKARQSIDSEATSELLKIINKYHNLYVDDLLNRT
jgi:DNA-binding XRE family transcriptional regulator